MADSTNKALDEIYTERARCVAAFARMLLRHGYVVGFTTDPAEPDWPVLIAVLDGVGQISFHYSREERYSLAGDIPDEPTLQWDGHSTEEKYRRLDAWGKALGGQ